MSYGPSSLVGRRLLGPMVGACVLACGGNVNLGGERSSDAGTVLAAPDGGVQPDGGTTTVVRLADTFFARGMAVAGDFIYLSGHDERGPALVRCKKQGCQGTAQFMPVPALSFMQVYGNELGVVTSEGNLGLIASYNLPDLTQEQKVIGNLPLLHNQPVRFHGGFVFWSLPVEQGLYRCGLPDCPSGPQRLQLQSASASIRAEGELLFWTAQGVLRAGKLGEESAQTLGLDPQLTTLPADAASAEPAYEAFAIEVSQGMLYAASYPRTCEQDCQWTLARWPSQGGPREVLIESALSIHSVFVEGGEIAWVERDSSREDGTLFSCLVESCAPTRRELGTVQSQAVVTSDERSWYWLRAENRGPDDIGRPRWHDRQLQRTPLLPGTK